MCRLCEGILIGVLLSYVGWDTIVNAVLVLANLIHTIVKG